jgi:hypothetical protein
MIDGLFQTTKASHLTMLPIPFSQIVFCQQDVMFREPQNYLIFGGIFNFHRKVYNIVWPFMISVYIDFTAKELPKKNYLFHQKDELSLISSICATIEST